MKREYDIIAQEILVHKWTVEAKSLKGAKLKALDGCPSDKCSPQEFEIVSVDGIKVPRDGPCSMAFSPDEWTELAEACRSKAVLVSRGFFDPEDRPGENKRWIADLMALADRIEEEGAGL